MRKRLDGATTIEWLSMVNIRSGADASNYIRVRAIGLGRDLCAARIARGGATCPPLLRATTGRVGRELEDVNTTAGGGSALHYFGCSIVMQEAEIGI